MIWVMVQCGEGLLVGEDIIELLVGDENVLFNWGCNVIDEVVVKCDV